MAYRDGQVTLGGSTIYDHRNPAPAPMSAPEPDLAYLDAVTAHVERLSVRLTASFMK